MELLLVRHAQPERVEDVAHADPELNELGRRQADALGAWWAHRGIDAIWSSPARRARQTAAPLAERTGLEVAIDDRLTEYDWGSSSYIPYEQARHEVADHVDLLREFFTGDGEAFVDWRERARSGVEAVAGAHRGQRVVVMCHGGVIVTYLAHVLGLADPLQLIIDYTGVSRVLAATDGARSLAAHNETGHLAAMAGATPTLPAG